MDIVTKNQKKAEKASDLLTYKITYIPGVTEDLDLYKASHELLNVHCYGGTEKEAIASAKMESAARFLEQSTLADEILMQAKKSLLTKRKINK